ncbi:hypothetical protein M5D96_004641 [Drosophila gunungcola]|uniref:Uncharacterized protein n=1 Tax=Drosophila gunungcola TaxID=103775 RepID=A0A9Q0BSU1_9MUSC|nr:hypothetical protein M5D96_004641 [Drosophila gunungcola]
MSIFSKCLTRPTNSYRGKALVPVQCPATGGGGGRGEGARAGAGHVMQSAQECKWAFSFSGDWRRARAPNYSNGGGLMECPLS